MSRKLLPQIELGIVCNSTGSSKVKIGKTEVICSIFGPKVDKVGNNIMNELCKVEINVQYCPFAFPSKLEENIINENESKLSEIILDTLNSTICRKLYPKCTISIFITITQAFGDELGCSLIACSLAMIDASIESYDIIAPYSIMLNNENNSISPTKSIITGAYSSSLDRFLLVNFQGRYDATKVIEFLDLVKKGSEIVREELKESIKQLLLEK